MIDMITNVNGAVNNVVWGWPALILLAAKNAGIKTVIVPEKNRRDVAEISAEIKKGLQIVYAEQMEDVLKIRVSRKSVRRAVEKAYDY